MAVVIGLLRGVNVGGRHLIRMEALRNLCESLKLKSAQTYLQSGNVVFRTEARDLSVVAAKLESAIETSHGFRPSVILRTLEELRAVVSANPFAGRDGIEPSKLLVTFLSAHPEVVAAERLRGHKTDPEELALVGRDLFIYFPVGIGKSKLSLPAIDRILKMQGTARNWNTVNNLIALAEKL